MGRGIEPEQTEARRRPAQQIERLLCEGAKLAIEFARAVLQIVFAPLELPAGSRSGNLLTHDTTRFHEAQTQCVVAPGQCIERAAQCGQEQFAFQTQRAGHVVGGAVRFEPPQHPQTFLCMRQRHTLAGFRDTRNRHILCRDRRLAGARQFGQFVEIASKALQPGMIEDGLQRHVAAYLATHARQHAHSEQRMATEPEEIIMCADTFDAQHITPDLRE
ncbi:hypothetical protein LMG22931_06076 [Paraburkholderia nemoris]|nr:hypothetical protein LMG22931_06076 [Paraburkholderia nemoris]